MAQEPTSTAGAQDGTGAPPGAAANAVPQLQTPQTALNLLRVPVNGAGVDLAALGLPFAMPGAGAGAGAGASSGQVPNVLGIMNQAGCSATELMSAIASIRAQQALAAQQNSAHSGHTLVTAQQNAVAARAMLLARMAAANVKPVVDHLDDNEFSHGTALGDAAAAAEDVTEEKMYETYTPKHLNEGGPHPDPVVETSSLAGVSPPPITYKHHLHDVVAAQGLSGLQLESVLYANMRHEGKRLADGTRGGFFLGDAAGVGKGRQLAGMVLEHFRCGRQRAVWFSVSKDLKFDAQRDLNDLGEEAGGIPLYPKGHTNFPAKGTLSSHGVNEGVVFWTYSLLIHGAGNLRAWRHRAGQEEVMGAIFKKNSRVEQLVQWLKGEAGEDPLIIFDECHKAKNLLPKDGHPTQTALVVCALQQALPHARVVYASATGATEPANLGYMTRLGTFGFEGITDLLRTVDASGMGAMEMFALGLKSVGAYLCRSLSFAGAEFELSRAELPRELQVMYDRAAEFWQLLFRVFNVACSTDGVMTIDYSHEDGPIGRTVNLRAFWNAHQRFFRSLLMCFKVPTVARAALDAVHNQNMCVVIGLQSTGESSLAQAEEEAVGALDDFVSTPQMVLKNLVRTQFPTMVDRKEAPDFTMLCAKLRPCLRAWTLAATAAQTVLSDERRRSRRDRGQSEGAAGAAGDGSDDDLQLVGERSCEEVLLLRRQQAMRDGNFLDLTGDTSAFVQPEDAATAEKRMEEAAAQAAELRAIRAREAAERLNAERRAVLSIAEHAQPVAATKVKMEAQAKGSEVLQEPAAARVIEYEEIKDEPCTACGGIDSTDDNDILFCDGCDDGWHMHCVKPRVQEVPEGDWFCPKCERKKRLMQRKASKSSRSRKPMEKPKQTAATRNGNGDGGSGGDDSDSDIDDVAPADAPRGRLVLSGSDGEVEVAGASKGEAGGAAAEVQGSAATSTARPAQRAGKAAVIVAESGSDEEDAESDASVVVVSDEEESDEEELEMSDESEDYPTPVKGNGKRKAPPSGTANVAKKVKKDAASRTAARLAKDEAVRVRVKRRGGRGGGGSNPIGQGRHLNAAHALLGGAAPGAGAEEVLAEPELEADEMFLVPNAALVEIKAGLLAAIDTLELPPNPLDHLIDLMGGTDEVAEMTGRHDAMVRDADAMVKESRAATAGVAAHKINLHERDNFQSGRKLIAVISEAASSGISLQADRRADNQRRRLHLTLELPWSADRAIQQFGRTHRSNQVSAPIYRIIVTEAGGEARFASSAAKRLQALGALLKADRRTMGAGSELKSFDVDNKYGHEALKQLYNEIASSAACMTGLKWPTMSDEPFDRYMQKALSGVGLDVRRINRAGINSREVKVAVFLNKLLGLKLEDQSKLFTYFNEIYAATVRLHKSRGDYDEGMVEFAAEGGVRPMDETFGLNKPNPQKIHECEVSGAVTYCRRLCADRGVSRAVAEEKLKAWRTTREEELARRGEEERTTLPAVANYSGFWIAKKSQYGYAKDGTAKHQVLLALEIVSRSRHMSQRTFRLFRPNNGDAGLNQLDSLLMRYTFQPDTTQEVQDLWEFWYNKTDIPIGQTVGITVSRHISICLLTGAILPVWKNILEIYRIFNQRRAGVRGGARHNKMTVVRTEITETGEQVVGLFPEGLDEEMLDSLVECVQAVTGGAMDTHQEHTTGASPCPPILNN